MIIPIHTAVEMSVLMNMERPLLWAYRDLGLKKMRIGPTKVFKLVRECLEFFFLKIQ